MILLIHLLSIYGAIIQQVHLFQAFSYGKWIIWFWNQKVFFMRLVACFILIKMFQNIIEFFRKFIKIKTLY